jgi:hypothetical protein
MSGLTRVADEFAYFQWQVNSAGYDWTSARTVSDLQEGRSESRLIGEVSPGLLHSYEPLKTFSSLFRTFGLSTEPTESDIRRFANEYGLLGGSPELQLPPAPSGIYEFRDWRTGETLESWALEIATMRRLIHLWEAAKESRTSDLKKAISWQHDAVYFVDHSPLQLPASMRLKPVECECIAAAAHIHEDMFARLRQGDLFGPAYFYLQTVINDKLGKHNVRPSLLWSSTPERLSLNIVPKNLIGCLWLQFAKAVEGGKTYRQCANCRAWFEIGRGGGARSDKRHCSGTCKASSHRKKQDRARDLFQQGVPFVEIARELGTERETVKGWVKNERLSKEAE